MSGQTMSNDPTIMQVLVIRHGERVDEVEIKEYRRKMSEYEAKYGVPSRKASTPSPSKRAPSRASASAKSSSKSPLSGVLGKLMQQYATPPPPDPPKYLDSTDPLLTELGHQQAMETFQNLVPKLAGHRVAVFCSPLKRAIGTAVMLGSAPITDTNKVEWVALNNDDAASVETSERTENAIPITVLNQLGDFAAAVEIRGGIDHMLSEVKQSIIQKAKTGKAKGRDESRPVEISKIFPFAARYPQGGQPVTVDMPRIQAAAMSNMNVDLSTISRWPRPVSFWGRRSKTAENFSETLCTSNIQNQRLTSSDAKMEESQSMAYPDKLSDEQAQQAYNDRLIDPMESVSEAIEIASQRGCSVCVFVAHREAIYAMAGECQYWGPTGHTKTPYGGIGQFTAQITRRHSISLQFHGVWHPPKFQNWEQEKESILSQRERMSFNLVNPQDVTSPISRVQGGSSTEVFLYTGKVDQKAFYFATIKLLHPTLSNGHLGKTMEVRYLSERNIPPIQSAHDADTDTDHSNDAFHFDVVSGWEEWQHVFDNSLRGKQFLQGTTSWHLDDGTSKKILVRIFPRHQAPLPAPTTLQVEMRVL